MAITNFQIRVERHSLAVDLFEKNEMHVSLALHSQTPFPSTGDGAANTPKMRHKDVENALKELELLGEVTVEDGLAIFSMIGVGLKRSIGNLSALQSYF